MGQGMLQVQPRFKRRGHRFDRKSFKDFTAMCQLPRDKCPDGKEQGSAEGSEASMERRLTEGLAIPQKVMSAVRP